MFKIKRYTKLTIKNAECLINKDIQRIQSLVGRDGFEPSKAKPTDLQSVAFDRSATYPKLIKLPIWAGASDWNRTNNLLITNQLLYR